MSNETAVLELLSEQVAAWAAGDGTAFAATFTDDADFISVIGEFIHGRAQLAAGMQEGFDGFMRGTHLSEPERSTLRFPTHDTAILVTYGVRVLRPEQPAPPHSSVQIRTAALTNNGWQFTSFQNTRIVND
ncbi:SgcJ/EcaC family oxidoreductase [Nocardia salmonicida]|uniref:SgcJ/EcaC family oxidoreductase n=1 Tax=Nocardia salmonicida TaxID=53431 RepID=A0ABZ1NF00_9NOCA